MKAYKVFNPDWKCKEFQYEIGKTYEMKSNPILCEQGFHACSKIIDCFYYYKFNNKNKVAEVELLGKIVGKDQDKQATNKIKIIRELSWIEVLSVVNTGKNNTGYSNSGDRNSGHRNSGYSNSGHRNSGHRNSGYRNSGYSNSGHSNSGDRNSGHRNSGHSNSGYSNSGDSNSGYSNSGYSNSGDSNSGDSNSGYWNSSEKHTGHFNSVDAKSHYIFNRLVSSEEKTIFENSKGYIVCCEFYLIAYRVVTKTGKYGDFKYMSYKSSWKYLWSKLSIKDKKSVISMPFFDKDVFFEITGILTK